MRGIAISPVVAYVLMGSAAVGADPRSESSTVAEAGKLFEQGRVLMTNNDPVGACAKFDQAIVLDPLAAGTMLNLGLCNEKVGKYRTALYWFRKAQFRANETDPPLPDHEKAAREHSAKLAALVGTVTIAFEGGAPPDTQVTIDGEAINRADFPHVEVDPGHHVLAAEAPGKLKIHYEFDLAGKGGQTLTLGFVDGDSTIVVDRGQPRRRAALYVAGGGGVLFATSLGLTLYEKTVYNQYKAAAMQNNGDALRKTQHATEIARDYGTALVVGGVIAVGVAGYLYVTAPRPARIDRTVLVPTLAPQQIGLAATGWF